MKPSALENSTDTEVARSLLDQLLEDSRLYRKGPDYKNLLDFAVRLCNFAPFNALLLQIQKPGLNHAASARDWRETFGRTIKDGARPLLILWPFGPGQQISDTYNYVSETLREYLGATVFPAGSIVFAKVGAAVFLERKKVLNKASCLDNNMAAFVMDARRAHWPFIHYVLLSKKLGSLVNTTALPSLSGTVLSSIELPLPSLPEQAAIAAALTDMDAELAALQARRTKTRALKRAMMQKLLTGRIRLV